MTKSIAAPCTEIAHWTVPPGESVDALLELIEQLHAAFLRGEGLQGMHQAPTHENPNLVVNFLGWDSLEVSALKCRMRFHADSYPTGAPESRPT